MFRNYANPAINKNLRKARCLGYIALPLCFLTLAIYIGNLLVKGEFLDSIKDPVKMSNWLFMVIYLILSPLSIIRVTKPPKGKNPPRDSASNNDVLSLIFATIGVCFAFIVFTLSIIPALIFSKEFGEVTLSFIKFIAYTSVPYIPLYIATYYLHETAKLIKQSWKTNPPEWYAYKQSEKNRQKEEKIYSKNYHIYKAYIEKCGIKFFIKYAPMIKLLPIKDIEVTENYPFEEKMLRLNAIKELSDRQLLKFSAQHILKEYPFILSETEIIHLKSFTDNT